MRTDSPFVHKTIYCILAIAAIIAYFPLYKNGFISFDDHTYIYKNATLQKGVSWDGIKYAFSFNNQTSYWHPLTWLSLMLDYQLWGLNPTWYHLENLAIHTINGYLLFRILDDATSKAIPSFSVALLFLLHPTAVESVAWAVERKTVLSTLFFLMTLLVYLRYEKQRSLSSYTIALLCMALGLMAKSMVVTLPAVMLLLDLRPLGRLNFRSNQGSVFVNSIPLIIEKIPFFVLSVISIALSLFSHPGSTTSHQIPIIDRLAHALVSYCEHLWRIFWSSGYAVFYPLPQGEQISSVALSLMLLVAISISAILLRNSYPWITIGWFWFFITFAPVSGLVRAGKWPGMADRFLYIPAIGILIAICFTLSSLIDNKRNVHKTALLCLCAVAAFFTYSSNRHVQLWHDSVTLFSNTVQATPSNSYAHYLLGGALYLEKKNYINAEKHFQTAISLDPYVPYYKADLGEMYISWGKPQKALPLLKEAAQLLFDDPDVLNTLGSALIEADKPEEALKIIDRVLELKPIHKNAIYNRGIVLYKLQRFSEAKNTFTQLLATSPENIDAHINLGMTLIELKEYDASIEQTKKALLLSPTNADALVNIGIAFEKKNMHHEAITAYKKALAIKPDFLEASEGIKRLQQ